MRVFTQKPKVAPENLSTGLAQDFSQIPLQVGIRKNIQLKRKVNLPGDIYEQEADYMADQVVAKPDADSQLRRHTDGNGFVIGQPAIPKTIDSGAGGSGQCFADSLRAYFEPRFGYGFSRVRIHTDRGASSMAELLNARAFTVDRDIAFGGGAYAPHTTEGRRLMAHELTHVIQQGGAERIAGAAPSFLTVAPGYIQRDIAEEQLPHTPVEQIMADENYFENGIQLIEFYSAELAILRYRDGSEIRLGLVPEYISEPFEAVDYRTPRAAHIPVSPTAPSLGRGSIRFIPRGREAQFPAHVPVDIPRLAEEVGRTIRFTHHPSGHIVPTEVNSISAPRLSEALREAEAVFVRQFEATSEGAIQMLERLERVILLASLYEAPAAGGSRAPAPGRPTAGHAAAAAVTRGAAARAQSTLVRFFNRLLRSGASEAVTVEGVGFGGVRVATRGTELMVSRTHIFNVSRIPGRGRLIHAAFERAAIQAARQAGSRTARVALELVENPKWAAYLESQGYTFQLITTEGGGFVRVLTKVFTL